MSTNTLTVEERLARYRPALQEAISQRGSTPNGPETALNLDLFDFDQHPNRPQRSATGPRLLVAAAVIALVVGLGALVATRQTTTVAPADTATEPEAPTATSENIDDQVVDTAVVVATPPVEAVEGSGSTPVCSAGIETVGTGTLYLGGPASAQSLAADGFIFSLPAGTEPVDVAIKSIALPVLGLECSITARPNPDGSTFTVNIEPPAVPSPLELDVAVRAGDDVVGVTGIDSGILIEVDSTDATPTVRLLGGIPESATTMSIRFKKGDDVWFLGSEPTAGADIALAVPNGETDRFPDQSVDWVLITAINSNERLVGVVGMMIP